MLQVKPPVVAVLGHVDHGKTSLLDRIRQTNVAAKEAGQITQAIGASQIVFKGQKITFLDTPGHEAFIKMRSRGAQVADLAILVVAVNDGVMPQTKESIRIIKEAKIPFLVAVSKIDLPGFSVDKIKAQLAENEVFAEGYGGQVVVVPVSARTGEGIEQLLEMILLVAEMAELKADSEEEFSGIVIESIKDHLRGVMATLLVKNGTLKIGEEIFGPDCWGRVKALTDEHGRRVGAAVPGQPVEVLGWEKAPAVGITVQKGKPSLTPTEVNKLPVDLAGKKPEEKKLKIILRADCQGSLEAILGSLPAEVSVLESGVGEVLESDISLAKTFSALILTFNVKIPGTIAKFTRTEKIKIKSFTIIYDLLKEIEETVFKIMDPLFDREIVGRAEVIAEFAIRKERVAGVKVNLGKISKTDRVCLLRGGKLLAESGIRSMKHVKEEISQANAGQEIGLIFTSAVNFQKGDEIVACR